MPMLEARGADGDGPGRTWKTNATKRVWLAALLALGCGCLRGAGPAAPGAEVSRQTARHIRRFRCPSGLTVLFERDPVLPVVAVVSVVGVGATADPPGKEGLAHAVEHLTYQARGPSGLPRDDELMSVGAVWNGSTSWDAVTYWAAGARQALPRLLALEAGRLADPLAGLTTDDLEHERSVILNEVQLRGETKAIGHVIGLLQESVFTRADPFRRPVGGTPGTVAALTLDDARALAARYDPAEMTIYVSGDVDLDGAAALISQHVPAKLTGGAPVEAPAEAAGRVRARADEQPAAPSDPVLLTPQPAAVAGPEIWIAWTLPGAFGPTAGTNDLLANAAEAALDGYDLRTLDISTVDLWTIPGSRESLLICRAWLITGRDPDRAFSALASRVSLRWRDTIYDRYWYSYLRGATGARLLAEEDGVLGRARVAAQLAHFAGDPDLLRRRAGALRTIDAGTVAAVAKEYIVQARAGGVFVVPLPADARPTPGPSGVDRVRRLTDAGADASFADGIRDAHKLGAIERARLPNGLELVVVRRPAAVLTVLLGFHGGTADGPVMGAAEAFSNAAEYPMARPAETFGMLHRWRFTADDIVEVLRGDTASLPEALHLLRQRREVHLEWPSRPLFRRAAAIRQTEQGPEVKAGRGLMRALLGDHPYATRAMIQDVLAVSKEQVRAWWLAHERPDNALLVVAGDVDPAAVMAAARKELGSWRAPGNAPAPPAPPPPPPLATIPRPNNVVITHRPGAVQAELTLACLVPPAADGDGAAHDILASIVEDTLWAKLREELGATYDVSASVHMLRGGAAYLTVSTTLDHPHLTSALTAIRGYWDGPVVSPSEAVVDGARRAVSRRSVLEYQTTNAVALDLFARWNLGWRIDDLDARANRLATVRRAEIARLLEACRANSVVALVGDEPTIRAAWR